MTEACTFRRHSPVAFRPFAFRLSLAVIRPTHCLYRRLLESSPIPVRPQWGIKQPPGISPLGFSYLLGDEHNDTTLNFSNGVLLSAVTLMTLISRIPRKSRKRHVVRQKRTAAQHWDPPECRLVSERPCSMELLIIPRHNASDHPLSLRSQR